MSFPAAAPAKPADGGTTIIGGNIQIASDRGSKDGVARDCDPDPRFGTHPRPDEARAVPGTSRSAQAKDYIAFGRHIAQQDVSPIGSGDTGSGSGGGGMGDSSGDTDTSPDEARTSRDDAHARELQRARRFPDARTASCTIHSPRSVSTGVRPAASSAWLSLISSEIIVLPLAITFTPRRRAI